MDSSTSEGVVESTSTVPPASAPAPAPAPAATPYKPSSADFANYYENFMPYKSIFLWLNHSQAPQEDFTKREFAFEYKSGAYQRYNSFSNVQEFKNTIVKAQPVRFEVGAVYPIEPKLRKSVSKNLMKPVMKEFVLDIDLTDYDDVRTCCSGTSICRKCWKFITLAIKIVDAALREDFGFEKLIWVFSGRRGVHCWVSDYRVRILDEPRRRAIVEYLDVLNVKSKGNKNGISLRKPYHPHVERSFEILRDEFVDIILREQDPWRLDDRYQDLAKCIPDYRLSSALLKHWKEDPGSSSASKWRDVDTFYQNMKVKSFDIQDWKREMIFKTMYPRLDVEVSRQMIHLLKSPFCIHPGTGNVCVPFDPSVKEFDPFTEAPSLSTLFNEDETNWENTSLKGSIELFNRYVDGLVKDEVKEKREREPVSEESW
ncbi:DEKNAAC100987 [Brettanomyces naardenensis]|uniref:DNA primase n=1 Tax=Brettanomyces naardenensis TaxID=13370 RepID=A0A448YGU5_BRENA|nr:DEKNAAC100987 [Brettanomyces naardenensis]